MGSEEQIVIVDTGYHPSVADYIASDRYQGDRPRYIVDRDGTQCELFTDSNVIALVNDGPLARCDGRFYPSAVGSDQRRHPITTATPRIPYEYCSAKPYHGCTLYEYMSQAQIATLGGLLKEMLQERGIRYPYDNQLGAVCPRAQAGKSGIYFASSFDPRRWDIHPQIELIRLIKALAS